MDRCPRALPGLLLAACCYGPVLAQPAPAAPTASAAIAARLPLRRDEAMQAGGAGWAPALVVLGLCGAGGAWFWWRRSRASAPGRRPFRGEAVLRLSSQALTPQASVHAVRWRGEELLLACTAQHVTLLARRGVDGEEEPAP